MTDDLPTNPVAALFALCEGEYVFADAVRYRWSSPMRVDHIRDTGDERTVTFTAVGRNGTEWVVTAGRDDPRPPTIGGYGRLHHVHRAPGETATRDVDHHPRRPDCSGRVEDELVTDGPLSARELATRVGASIGTVHRSLRLLRRDERVLTAYAPTDLRVVEYHINPTPSDDVDADAVRAMVTTAARRASAVHAVVAAADAETPNPTNAGTDPWTPVGKRVCDDCEINFTDHLVEAVHAARVHDYDPYALDGHAPGDIEATIRQSEHAFDAADRLGFSPEKTLRLLPVLGIDHLLVPESCDVEWDADGQAVAADGGGGA